MKIKKSSLKIMFALFAAFILSLMGIVGIASSANAKDFSDTLQAEEARAANQPVSDIINITGRDRKENTSTSGNNSANPTFDEIACVTYSWKDTKSLVIKFDEGKEVPMEPSSGVNVQPYSYNIYMQFVKKRAEDGGTFELSPGDESDTLTKVSLKLGSAQSKEELKNSMSIEYFIDKAPALSPEGNQMADEDGNVIYNNSKDYGWGIYRFCFEITGAAGSQEFYSTFIYIEPSQITQAPQISARQIESLTAQFNAWEFTIDNYDEYVDGSRIVWFVQGTDNDGKKYSFGLEEIGTADFPREGNYTALNTSVERTGRTFKFEASVGGKGEVQGTWNVYCVVCKESYDPSKISQLVGAENELYRSEIASVNNLRNISKLNIFLIIGVTALALLVLIVVIISVTIKKERVW